MILLERFFKPKTQKNDPPARLKRVQNLPADDPLLAESAQQDEDPSIRCAALDRLTDLQVLQHIISTDSSLQVKEAATARFRALLAGTTMPLPPLQERLSTVPSLDAELVMFLASHAKEPELRLAALERIEDETLLAQAAINDHTANVRLAALARVHQATALEDIVKHSRNRDKRIYRTARERLDTMRTEQQRAERVSGLCQEMENLTWDGETGVNAARFPKLELEWQELLATADHAIKERYEQARARFLAHHQEGVAKRITRQEVCSTLEACAERLQNELEWTSELAATVQQTLQEAQQTWEQCGTVDDSEGRRVEQRYRHSQQILQEREKGLQRTHERAERLREVLQQADTLLNQASQVLDIELATLKQRWMSLERPGNRPLMQHLQGEFDTVLEKLKVRLHRQGERQDQEWQELVELVDALEKALDDGELQHAIAVYEQARQRLKQNIGLSRKQMAALDARLQVCFPRLGELRGWRRWGTHQAREHLCEEAETLVGAELPPLEIAERIKKLRATWKHLDGSSEGTVPRALWKRFDKACERAYEPCQAYFEAKTRERQHHLAQKQALCEQLEQFESETDWSRVDWREADRLLREAQKRWRKIGPINRADQKSLDRRFEAALKRLDKHLQQERGREVTRRQAIIAHVQELVDSTDVQAAVNAAKRAQAEWQPTVQASRREEQALWQQFRTVCDAVFARRQAEQQAVDKQRENNLAGKQALCEAIEALAAADDVGISQVRKRLQQAHQEWAGIGYVPKTALKAIDKRFETACTHLERRIHELQQQAIRQEGQNLRERAQLCSRLEELLYTPSPEAMTVVEAAQSKWHRLPPLPTTLAEGIQQRFDAVCQALAANGADRESLLQRLELNLDQKHHLCLRMEILAGVESPPQFAQARMECQVSRLSESLIHRDGGRTQNGPHDEVRGLEEAWYALGIPSAQEAALSERFNRALAKLTE